MLAPNVQVLALCFGEMVPCLLFGSGLEYRHNLFNCGGVQGGRPETIQRQRDRRQRAGGKEQRSKKVESTRDVKNSPYVLFVCVCVCSTYQLTTA